jgi:AbrB family looped-hinge helix DNA binding protein
MSTYVSKVTTAGQVTIPKKIREGLDIDDEDLLEFAMFGDAVLMRKLKASKAKLDAIRAKVRRLGLTRERVNEIVEEVRKERWKEQWE